MTSAIRWRIFACAAIAINGLAFFLVRIAPRPAVGMGAAFDVAVTVPLLYFLLIVRGGVQPLISILPLCLLGLVRATYLAPGIAWMRPAMAGAAEFAVILLIAGRVRRGLRGSAGEQDVLARMESAAREVVPSRRGAAILAGEIAIFFYAFAAWRRSAAEANGFSIHVQSGVAALFGVLAGVSVMEAALVHLVVMRWSAAAAWTLTGLSVYGAIWLVGAARAFGLRPVLVEGNEVIARSGMLWTVRVPLELIADVQGGSAEYELKMPPASEPNLVLRLARPVTAHGIYGMTRRVSSVALALDDREGFTRALAQRGYRGL
jgi:hypothetical protein